MTWRKGQAYGQDLRDRVLAVPGLLREVAERFGVSASYVVLDRKPSQPNTGAGSRHFCCNEDLMNLSFSVVFLPMHGPKPGFGRNLRGQAAAQSG